VIHDRVPLKVGAHDTGNHERDGDAWMRAREIDARVRRQCVERRLRALYADRNVANGTRLRNDDT